MAEAALRHSLALDPKQVVARRELAYICAMQHRRAAGDAQFPRLAELTALDYPLAFLWCQNSCDIWNPEEASPRLTRFVQADPDDRLSRLALALSELRSGKTDSAETVLAPLPNTDVDAQFCTVWRSIATTSPLPSNWRPQVRPGTLTETSCAAALP